MAVSKKIYSKKTLIWKYMFSVALLLIGLSLNFFEIGIEETFSYSSVGNFLIYCGFLMIFIVSLTYFFKKDRIVDERAEKIGTKAMSYVWLAIFFGGFSIMILDKIFHFVTSIGDFVSYAICFLILVYAISYKILERYN